MRVILSPFFMDFILNSEEKARLGEAMQIVDPTKDTSVGIVIPVYIYGGCEEEDPWTTIIDAMKEGDVDESPCGGYYFNAHVTPEKYDVVLPMVWGTPEDGEKHRMWVRIHIWKAKLEDVVNFLRDLNFTVIRGPGYNHFPDYPHDEFLIDGADLIALPPLDMKECEIPAVLESYTPKPKDEDEEDEG